MGDQTGIYFRNVYADLQRQLPQLPTDDPSPNLRECIQGWRIHPFFPNGIHRFCSGGERVEYVNFVRAEMLAKKHGLSDSLITHLQEMAILQYVVDDSNGHGVMELVERFGLSSRDIGRIMRLIEQEMEYPCFSFSRKTLMAADDKWAHDFQEIYAPILKDAMKGK